MKNTLSKQHLDMLKDYGLAEIDPSHIQLITFKKGELLCEQENAIQHILIIISGKVKVYTMTPDGKTLLFCFNGRGTMVGEVELMIGGAATSTLCAVQTVECLSLPFDVYGDELRNNPRFLYKASCAMAEIIARSTKNDSLNILYPLEERLKSYILMSSDDDWFDENLMETAQFLGVSYRHLLRMINKFCEWGYLRKEVKGYRMLDKTAFEIQKDSRYSR